MVFCNVSSTMPEAVAEMNNFIRNNDKFDIIEKVDKVRLTILDKKGNTHIFMSWGRYMEWCKGRTYVIKGTVYHSDCYVGEWKGEEK